MSRTVKKGPKRHAFRSNGQVWGEIFIDDYSVFENGFNFRGKTYHSIEEFRAAIIRQYTDGSHRTDLGSPRRNSPNCADSYCECGGHRNKKWYKRARSRLSRMVARDQIRKEIDDLDSHLES